MEEKNVSVNVQLLDNSEHQKKLLKSLKGRKVEFFLILGPNDFLKEKTYLKYTKKIREFNLNCCGVYEEKTILNIFRFNLMLNGLDQIEVLSDSHICYNVFIGDKKLDQTENLVKVFGAKYKNITDI